MIQGVMIMLERDCVFYDEKKNECKALNKLYCDLYRREKCRFKKTDAMSEQRLQGYMDKLKGGAF